MEVKVDVGRCGLWGARRVHSRSRASRFSSSLQHLSLLSKHARAYTYGRVELDVERPIG